MNNKVKLGILLSIIFGGCIGYVIVSVPNGPGVELKVEAERVKHTSFDPTITKKGTIRFDCKKITSPANREVQIIYITNNGLHRKGEVLVQFDTTQLKEDLVELNKQAVNLEEYLDKTEPYYKPINEKNLYNTLRQIRKKIQEIDNSTIRAPFDCLVNIKPIEGKLQPKEVIMYIYKEDEIIIECECECKDFIPYISINDQDIRGEVLDDNTTLKRIKFPLLHSRELVKEGSDIPVKLLSTKLLNGVFLKKDYVYTKSNNHYVYILNNDVAYKLQVITEPVNDTYVKVIGIKEGMYVVTTVLNPEQEVYKVSTNL